VHHVGSFVLLKAGTTMVFRCTPVENRWPRE